MKTEEKEDEQKAVALALAVAIRLIDLMREDDRPILCQLAMKKAIDRFTLEDDPMLAEMTSIGTGLVDGLVEPETAA